MLKTKRNVTRKLVVHKSSIHIARTNISIFTHKNSIAGSIVKHTCKDNQIKQVSHRVKQSRLAQFLRRLTTLTSVLQDKALRIMLVLTALYPTQSRLWSYVQDQKKCHKETCRAQVKHTHRAYNISIFTHKNSIAGSIVKHTCKDNQIKQVSHSVKQSKQAQFLRRLTTLTSVLQDKALRIMLVLTAFYRNIRNIMKISKLSYFNIKPPLRLLKSQQIV